MAKSAQKTSYKNLIVYQKAKQLTIDVVKYFSKYRLPKTQEFLVIQLLRAISSVGANIVEGYGRHYQKSYRQFLSIARGSAFEAEYWFEVALELNIFDNKKLEEFCERTKELIKMLTTMMKKLEQSA